VGNAPPDCTIRRLLPEDLIWVQPQEDGAYSPGSGCGAGAKFCSRPTGLQTRSGAPMRPASLFPLLTAVNTTGS